MPAKTARRTPGTPAKAEAASLYESTAAHLARLIDGGTFRAHERIPSVRNFAAQLHVSITTVLAAYRLLENRGYIEPRPQSGYFVRPPAARKAPAALPTMPAPAATPSTVSIRDLVLRVLNDALNPALVQLGAAIPNPRSLPTAKLNRTLARAARLSPDRSAAYAIPPGLPELRVQIARRALNTGCSLTPDELLITNGAQEAITLCLQTLCKPGDTVALESPCYYGFLQAIEALNLKALEIPAHPRDGMSLEALELALDQHPIAAVLSIPTFNNPLGSCMPPAKKKALVQLLAGREIPLIEDDIYGDLFHAGERPPTCKSFDKNGLVLLCDSFSKTLSPGLRVGYVAPGRYMRDMLYHKVVNSIATPTLPQMAVADFLATGGYDRHLRTLRKTLARQTRSLADAVLRYFPPPTKTTRPHGGHVLWVQLPESVDTLKLYSRAIDKGITLAPGPLFSAKSHYRNFIRLNAAFYGPQTDPHLLTLAHLVTSLAT